MFELTSDDFNTVTKMARAREGGREGWRASALRLKHKGYSYAEVADVLEITPRTVINIINSYENGGLEAALSDDPRPGRPVEFDDRTKCRIIAMVCSNPPDGFDRWSLSLIVEEAKKIGIVESIAKESVRIILEEHDLKPWREKMWCIPSLDNQFIERMEDVLDVYAMEHNEKRPLVCLDEKSVILRGETRDPILASPGELKKTDFEYTRNGTANLFLAFEPQEGQYWTKVTEKRASTDFAEFLAEIAAEYSDATKVTLVMDNLSTHTKKALTDRFGTEAGTAIWEHFDIHYTPVHGSWLNQAEIAIGMYSRQCLGKSRIPDIDTLKKKTKNWTRYINEKAPTVEWSFSAQDAREKFKYG